MKTGAFTLIEILVVLAVISIFVALLVPTFSTSFEKRKFGAGIRRIMDTADLARTSSVAENRTFRLYYDIEKNGFFLASEPDPVNSPGNFEPLKTEEGQFVELPGGTFIRDANIGGEQRTSGIFHVSFYKDGSCDETLIHLEDTSRAVCTVYFQGGLSLCRVFYEDVSLEWIKDVNVERIEEKKSRRKKESRERLHSR